MSINVSILGATGYSGAELLRILLSHPKVRIKHLSSESQSGAKISSVLPDLAGRYDLTLEKAEEALGQDTDLFFLALPAGSAMRLVPKILKLGKKVIDLSADFRLKDVSEFERTYQMTHEAPAPLKQAVYGLPELYAGAIKKSSLVANPGCYATAVILAAAPLLKNHEAEPEFVADAKSGVSGAGKKLELRYLFAEVSENFSAYAVARHRHRPEMEQTLKGLSGQKTQIVFTPHLVPMNRGILATCYFKLRCPASSGKLLELYKKFYHKAPFVRIRPEGSFPETRHTLRTNFCDIGLTVEERTQTAVVISAIDNLVKGASGQAVQNMNLMMGWKETEGLL